MSKRHLTFDQFVYIVVALPTLFFGSYVVTAVLAFFLFQRFSLRGRFELWSQWFGWQLPAEHWNWGIWLVFLVPAFLMTRHFFKAGWPENQ